MQLLELLLKGGWVMIPIGILSILAIYAIVERMLVVNRGTRPKKQWLYNLEQQILSGDRQGAILSCEQKNNPITRVLKTGIQQLDQAPKALEATMESTAQAEVYKLEKNLTLLATVASTAPMLGFLGTVLGMIQAFMAMAQSTTPITPQLLSNGIYEAMITTAAGLLVGIIADLGYKYVVTRVQNTTYQMEQASQQLMEWMQETAKNQQTNHEA